MAGVVQDQTGAVLPHASVALLTAASSTPVTTTTTDADGRFRLESVAPGTYDLRTEFPGFRSNLAHVRVTSRAPSALTVVMELEGVTQVVSVNSGGPGANAEASANVNAVSVDANMLDNLPVLDQDVVAAVSRFLDSSAIGTNGTSILVDGVEVNALALSASAIQQIKINQDPYSAEFMRPGRGRIEIITKPGGKDYNGTLNLRFRDSDLYAKNAFAETKAPEQRRIVEGTFGGPVPGTTKTNFLLSESIDSEANQSIVYAAIPSGIYQQNVSTPYRSLLLGGTWSHQQGERNTLSVRFSHFDRKNTNQGVGGTTLPEAGFDHDDREDEMTFSDQTILSSRLLHDFKLLFGVEHEPRTSATAAPKLVVVDAFTGGGAQNDSVRTEHHFTLVDAITWSPKHHVVRAGVNIPDWSWRGFNDQTNSLGTFYFSSLTAFGAQRPYSFIAQRGNGQADFLEKVVGLFAQDEVHPKPNLSVVIGVRYDWQNYFHDTNNLAPRASFAFAPVQGGKTVIRGGAGVFYDRTGPGPILDILRYNGTQLLRYVVTDPGFPDPFSGGGAARMPPPAVVRLGPDVRIPHTLQYSIGVERELRPRTTMAVNVIGTRGDHLFRSRDVNAPAPPDYTTRPDPGYGEIRQIESDAKRRTATVEFTVKTQTKHFTGQAQYSETHASDDTSGINWMPPNNYDVSGEYGPSDFERRHVLELYGTVNVGPWVNAGVSFEGYSGRPYSMTLGLDPFNTGYANARPAGVTRNSRRGPGFADLDVRWWRDFTVSSGPKKRVATVGVDVFNVTNRVNYPYYVGTLSSPFFGQPVAALAPLRVQFSFRLRY